MGLSHLDAEDVMTQSPHISRTFKHFLVINKNYIENKNRFYYFSKNGFYYLLYRNQSFFFITKAAPITEAKTNAERAALELHLPHPLFVVV